MNAAPAPAAPACAAPRRDGLLCSLRARVLLLIGGFGVAIAVVLSLVMYTAVRSYYVDVVYEKSSRFAEAVMAEHPDLWDSYQADPARFGQRLREYVLFAPQTGLYLLDIEGRVLASAGEGRIFWSNWRVDVDRIGRAIADGSGAPIEGDDPDVQGKTSLVAVRPVLDMGVQKGWLYVVARAGNVGEAVPEHLRSYAIRTAVKVGLITLAVGVLLTLLIITVLTRPLTSLTRVAERVRESGFDSELDESDFAAYGGRSDEIGRLSASFREMIDRLKLEMHRVTQADAKRREMVASVSHDLRTPLTALMGQLETVRLKGATLPVAEQHAMIERALQNAHHLKRLTDALAELARLDNPEFRVQPEPIAIGELADDVVQRYAERAAAGDVKLVVDYPDRLPLTPVDAALVERALANLLDNALRYTPPGGTVRVAVVREAGEIRVQVSDTGPGVRPEDQPRVFERFFQADSCREQRGSAGLGLAIVQRVAELHGGRAGLESRPGQGATFFIALPAAA